MAATVLNSPRAVEMTIHVVRAFVQLRDLLAANRQLAAKFAELERKVSSHDQAIVGIDRRNRGSNSNALFWYRNQRRESSRPIRRVSPFHTTKCCFGMA